MSINPIIFLELAFSIFVLGIALVVLILGYEKVLHSLHLAEEAKRDLSKDFYSKRENILEDARRKALSIIEEANLASAHMLSQTHDFHTKSEQVLKNQVDTLLKQQNDILEKNSLELLKQYGLALENLEQKNINLFQKVSQDVERDAGAELKNFKEVLEKETFTAQKIVGQKIEEQYKKVEEELVVYRTERLKHIDESIYKILMDVSKMVLSKTLRVEDHEQLVLDALDQAKKQNGSGSPTLVIARKE